MERITINTDDDLGSWVKRHLPSASRYCAAVLAAQRMRVERAQRIVDASGIHPDVVDYLIGCVDEPEGLPGGRRLERVDPDVADAITVLAEERRMTDV